MIDECYLEERVRDGLVEHGISDGGHPLVDKVDDSRLARHDELLVLSGRLDAVVPHKLGNELVSRHEHDVREEEVVEKHVRRRGVRPDDVLVAGG